MNNLMVLINEEGEFLKLNPKEIEGDSKLVPLEGYYEVLNEQRYNKSIWDFNLQQWIGVGEQRPVKQLSPSTDERIKSLEDMVIGLLDVIMMGGL